MAEFFPLERLETLVEWSEPTRAGRVMWEGQSLQSTLRRGWYFGTQKFRENLLAKFGVNEVVDGQSVRIIRPGDASAKDRDVSKARGIIAAGLRHFGLEGGELPSLRKNDRRKALLAWMITEATSVSHEWITTELTMGHKTSVSRLANQMKNEVRTNKKLGQTKENITRFFS